MSTHPNTVSVNDRTYNWPSAPVVIVCIDGSEPDYIEQAIAGGHMPYLAKAIKGGADLRAHCVVPSFTNPNNLSICLLYTSPSPRDVEESRMPSSA